MEYAYVVTIGSFKSCLDNTGILPRCKVVLRVGIFGAYAMQVQQCGHRKRALNMDYDAVVTSHCVCIATLTCQNLTTCFDWRNMCWWQDSLWCGWKYLLALLLLSCRRKLVWYLASWFPILVVSRSDSIQWVDDAIIRMHERVVQS